VGTALAAFEVGSCPLLVPRRFSLGEHVDDHQIQIAEELGRRGLCVTVDADALTLDNLLEAAGRRVRRAAQAPAFATSGSA
jgi:UDP-N-acetylglucosamine transferase subunit ALG13